MKLSNVVALVTGGASGLGLATARRLHEGGAKVAILDLPGSAGGAVAEAIGEQALFTPADVTSESAVAAAVETAARLGPLRVVINCAGTGNAFRTGGKQDLSALA